MENSITTFAKLNLSIKAGSYKLKRRITRIVMESEMQLKHREKEKLRQDIRSSYMQLKAKLSLILYQIYT